MDLVPDNIAHGGSAVARIGGKAFFVDGALPGETIAADVELEKGSWGRLRLREVLVPSPSRVEPRCRHFGSCGGCQWQFAAYGRQLVWKRAIVIGQLEHLGNERHPPVRPTVAPGPPFGYRNRMDFGTVAGDLALLARRSRRKVPVSGCDVIHANLAEVLPRLGRLDGVRELTLRTATTTGAVLAIVSGDVPDHAVEWGCAVARETSRGLEPIIGEPELFETVAGVRFRITGRAFFQNNTAGAEELIRLVAAAAAVGPEDTLLDAFAGGGLFAATVGRDAARVLAVERDAVAAADLRHNLAGIGAPRLLRGDVSALPGTGERWDVAVADPPRRGLGEQGVIALTGGAPHTIAYVSCDPASLARDTRLLHDAGYDLEWVTPVDMFPQTFHVECVARYRRSS
jgi:23S rRNA (uracil1939-C5)-methyltransferase